MQNAVMTANLLRRGRRLDGTTPGWNVVGTVVVVAAAIAAHSIALTGFGRDALIDICAVDGNWEPLRDPRTTAS